jgi:tetrahydromethanopterin S-methyltransferase subunit A
MDAWDATRAFLSSRSTPSTNCWRRIGRKRRAVPPLPPRLNRCPIHLHWPPLPGDYTVLDKDAAGAVCTLADEDLYEELRRPRLPGVALVGMLTTENLGIERLVRNVVACPRIAWLLLCGTDSRGHRAGACLAALSQNGVDSEMRIVDSPGKRARLVNLSFEEVEAFRRGTRVVPRIGLRDVGEICRLAEEIGNMPSAERAEVVCSAPAGERVDAQPVSPADPEGYFVIDVHADKDIIRLEHHTPDHRMTVALIGSNARNLYLAAIRRGLVSRPDHAAYLGYELGRAERALTLKTRYVQDHVERQGSWPISRLRERCETVQGCWHSVNERRGWPRDLSAPRQVPFFR